MKGFYAKLLHAVHTGFYFNAFLKYSIAMAIIKVVTNGLTMQNTMTLFFKGL